MAERSRLISNQAATIMAFTSIVDAGRKAKLAPLTWTVGGDSPYLSGSVDMLVWPNGAAHSDEAATAAARLAAFEGWATLIEGLTTRSIDEYGHHPNERLLTRFDRWEPRDTAICTEYHAYARNVSVDVNQRHCAWLISLSISTAIDKPTDDPADA